ncbi:MAG: thioredoxin family protein [Bacteroidetes bacterium]|nr:thioredoxin family protein [Bacteroidota bacterium]
MKRLFYSTVFALITLAVSAQTANKANLTYMIDNGVYQGLSYAKQKSKPVLLYFNSVDCHGCEMFSNMVMSNNDVINYTKSNFVSINANIEQGDARRISRKYKAFMLPALILINPEQDFEFTCNLNLDKDKVLFQMKNFFNAVALREQILLLQKTNHLSFEEAAKQIGASYAKIDFRKNGTADPEQLFEVRSLGMKYFNACGDAYFEEWMEQKTKMRVQKGK